MIQTADGWAVERLLRHVLVHPDRYRRLLVCVPFIDSGLIDLLLAIAHRARRSGCSVVIITTPFVANRLRQGVAIGPRSGVTIVSRSRLHAKVYLVEGRHSADSESIIT